MIEEALERAGISRRIALRVPHFTVVPMVLERTDLILTLPARVARVYEKRGNFKSLPLPVPIPPADVGVHWHERCEGRPRQPLAAGARLVVELHSGRASAEAPERAFSSLVGSGARFTANSQ